MYVLRKMPLETGGGQNDYGSEDTYNGRGNRRNGTYSGTGTYNDGGNGTYGTYDQPYNNGGNGTYNRSHNNRGNGTYNGTYNRRTGQNQQDDNLMLFSSEKIPEEAPRIL